MIKQRLLGLRKIFTRSPFENVLLFLLKGADYRGRAVKLIPPPKMYEPGFTKRVTRDAITYDLDRSCLMHWYVYWGLKDVTRPKLYSLVNKGDVVFDVGTNIGETLLNFALLVGPEGFVYGFEPDDVNFGNVQRNIALNEFENVHVFKFGISDRQESVKLYRVDPHNLGMNRILSEAEVGEFDDFTTIETKTLDDVVTENGIQRVDVVKIDIEGYEMHALRGAKRLLSDFKPKLFIEVGYTRLINNGTSPAEMIEFLNRFGYKVFHADNDQLIDRSYDFSPLGDGGIDVYALPEKTNG
jgi:FkbM family methyltransferase